MIKCSSDPIFKILYSQPILDDVLLEWIDTIQYICDKCTELALRVGSLPKAPELQKQGPQTHQKCKINCYTNTSI